MRIEGYGVVEALYDGVRTTVLRARRLTDDRPVAIKQLRSAFPSGAELMRLRREHDLTRAAAGPGVVAMYGMHVRDGMAWLEMQDCGGESLEALCSRKPPTTQESLEIACSIVDALEHIHRLGVVHRDIHPGNVMVDPDTRVATLIDFGIASTMSLPVALSAGHFEGSPAYMSPEQTGRMNRSLDWRSDYYSLGATLYHLLTGIPPFPGSDPVEAVYAHIARRPTSPRLHNPAIPEVVSDIVLTLLAKRAEDRYQSAAGLRHDLRRCLDALREDGTVAPFALRAEDHVETLQIPDTLYGRAEEIHELEAAIERVAGGASEAVFVTGAPGSGKTSLVGEVHRGTAVHQALFVSARFEPFAHEVPYAPVLHALGQLVHQILGLEASRVEAWRARIAEALGDAAPVVTEALPELTMLLGKQPVPPSMSVPEAEHGFRNALARLIAALPVADRPAVLFFDNLQWADPASVALLQQLVSDPELHGLLVLGTWRSDEVDAAHILSRALAHATKLGARYTTIELGPLALGDVQALLAETLGESTDTVAELARLSHTWTGGNPFLLHRVTDHLRDQGLLHREGARWTWDLAEISRRGLGEDAAGFVAGRLAELPPDTRRALEVASCIGASFLISVLASVLGLPQRDVMASLAPAIALRLVHPLHEAWWPEATDDIDFEFAFAHDRIQEAAHACLEPGDIPGIHLRIGTLLRQRAEASVFDVVHHLNLAVGLLSPGERVALSRLDAEAGRRALRSGVFASASQLLEQAVALLAPDAWEADLEGTRSLTLDAARAASLAGAAEQMDAQVDAALAHASEPLHRAAALEIRALNLAGRDILQAVDVSLLALNELGVSLPRRPTMADVGAAMEAAMGALTALGPDGVVALPDLEDPIALAVVRLANAIMAPAYLAVPLLLPILAAEIVRQTIARGYTPPAAYGYAVLALVLTAGGALEPGHQIARLCLRLMERSKDHSTEARPGHVVMGHVLTWTIPLREAVAKHREYLPYALAAGDHEYAAWIAHLFLANAFFAGTSLDGLATELDREVRAMRRLGQHAPLDCTVPEQKLVRALRGQTPRCDRMDADGATEEEDLATLVASGSRGAVYVLQTCRLYLRFLMRDLDHVLEIADEGEAYADGAASTYHVVVFRQTLALACIALAGRSQSADEKSALLARARANRVLLDAPAAHAPHNHRHRTLLIDAELARVDGDLMAAIDGYDAAIDAARTNGFLQDEALANELAGRFHLARGRLTPARAYLLEACGAWARWGASARLTQLEAEIPEVVSRLAPAAGGTGSTTTLEDFEIDLATLSKATLAITSELRTDQLVERILAVSVENAGATRGLVLLERDGALRLEAVHGEGISARGTVLSEVAGVPQSILQYVARTGARLVLPDARTDTRFSSDPALAADKPLSVLALPLMLRGRASGMIYLENDLTPDAFPSARIQLQEMLGAQAVISLENARLYDEAEALVRSTARFVPTAFLAQLRRRRLIDVVPGDAVELEMTVLLTDLRGFTRMTERLGPGPTFALLNAWLGRLTRVIARRGGFVHDIVGDAALALFPGEPDSALHAAVEIAAIPREMAAAGEAPADLGVGIGINAGPVMLGTLGSEHRLAISVVGDPVNTAARLESATKGLGMKVLLARAVVERLRSPQGFGLRPLGRVAVHGRLEALDVVELLDVLSPAERTAIMESRPRFAEALAALRDGRVERAVDHLDACIAQCPTDVVAVRLRERLRRGGGTGGKEDVEFV